MTKEQLEQIRGSFRTNSYQYVLNLALRFMDGADAETIEFVYINLIVGEELQAILDQLKVEFTPAESEMVNRYIHEELMSYARPFDAPHNASELTDLIFNILRQRIK